MKLAKMKTSDTPPPGGACRESRSPIQKCYSLSGKPRDSFLKNQTCSYHMTLYTILEK